MCLNILETEPGDPPTKREWILLTNAAGGKSAASRLLRVSRRAVDYWCTGEREGPWAMAELLRRILVERGH